MLAIGSVPTARPREPAAGGNGHRPHVNGNGRVPSSNGKRVAPNANGNGNGAERASEPVIAGR
jgi:hypothetical protein